jgi:hypothetical protein
MFARAAHLETVLNERRRALGKDPAYLTRYGTPLASAISAPASPEFDTDDDPQCDSGWCMT